MVLAFAVAAPLAVFVPLAVKAWQKKAFAWDEELSRRAVGYEQRQTFLNSYVDVPGLVLHPATQLLGAAVVVAVLLALVARGHRRTALLLGLSVGGAAIGAPLLKEVFARPPVDPDSSGYSFPSGHALRTMAAAAALAIIAWPTAWRRATLVVGAVVVGLTGVAVVYDEWHWASDVLAAWFLGVAWVACIWLALRPVYPSRGVRDFAPSR